MGWAGFSFDCRTEHRVFDEGSPTAIRYRDDIVHPTVSHFAGCIGEDFVLRIRESMKVKVFWEINTRC